MNYHFCIITILLLLNQTTYGKCKYTIPADVTYFDAFRYKFRGGDTLCIEGGTRRLLQIKHLLGDSLNPIVIINKGQVIINNTDFYYGFKIHNCQYFKLTGTGSPDITYGFRITGTGAQAPGLHITGLSSDFEVEYIEVCSTGFSGIMSKSDPSCDYSTNRENFLQKNVRIHHNYIHDVAGEGMYIGNSFYRGFAKSRKCMGDTLFPHEIWSLRVYNNKIENTAWEGIQIGCASKDVQVYNNIIQNFGLDKMSGQNNGLQIGEGTTGLFFNNIIRTGNGNGIIVLGQGQILIYNNYIGNCRASGIFCDNRTDSGNDIIAVFNNTIDNFGLNGIRWYNENAHTVFSHNLIIDTDENEKEFFLFHPHDLKQESENNQTGKSYKTLNVVIDPEGNIECQTVIEHGKSLDLLKQLMDGTDIPLHNKMGAWIKADQFR